MFKVGKIQTNSCVKYIIPCRNKIMVFSFVKFAQNQFLRANQLNLQTFKWKQIKTQAKIFQNAYIFYFETSQHILIVLEKEFVDFKQQKQIKHQFTLYYYNYPLPQHNLAFKKIQHVQYRRLRGNKFKVSQLNHHSKIAFISQPLFQDDDYYSHEVQFRTFSLQQGFENHKIHIKYDNSIRRIIKMVDICQIKPSKLYINIKIQVKERFYEINELKIPISVTENQEYFLEQKQTQEIQTTPPFSKMKQHQIQLRGNFRQNLYIQQMCIKPQDDENINNKTLGSIIYIEPDTWNIIYEQNLPTSNKYQWKYSIPPFEEDKQIFYQFLKKTYQFNVIIKKLNLFKFGRKMLSVFMLIQLIQEVDQDILREISYLVDFI